VPNFTRWKVRAKESEVRSVTHSVQMAVEDYKATPGSEGLKPSTFSELTIVAQCYLPYSVQYKRNPFNMLQTYGTNGLVFGAPNGSGEVGYQYYAQIVPYTISCWGGTPGVIILTLIEGQ